VHLHVGKPKQIQLVHSQAHDSLFRQIYIFLLVNDPLMMIINSAFKQRYPKESKSGKKIIDNWDPDIPSYGIIQKRIKDELNEEITMNELKEIIKGPIDNINEYHRMKSNLTTFVTRTYESNHHSRCTRKLIKYKSSIGKHSYAMIENMLSLRSHSVTRLSKLYNLIVIHNYESVGNHISGLPYVKLMSKKDNIYHNTPVIEATAIYSHNVAAWPAGKLPSANSLVVQIECVTDETTL
jgi:hypothetical protein